MAEKLKMLNPEEDTSPSEMGPTAVQTPFIYYEQM